MKITNAIAKVEKCTGQKVQKNGPSYSVTYNNKVFEFMQNGQEGTVTCISTRHVKDTPDPMTDYFPYVWHTNITRALKFLGAL